MNIDRFHREADGTYVAETGPAFQASTVIGDVEFSAYILPVEGGWLAETFTFGLPLARSQAETLEAAKGFVRSTFAAVNV